MEWDEEERAPLSHSYTDVGDDTRIWETPEEAPLEEVPEKPQKKHYVWPSGTRKGRKGRRKS